MKKYKYCSEILVAVVAGFLGLCVGVGLVFWARLPDHTVDLLTFSESAFGIGITVIALIFALVTVNQIKEIDRRFAEITKDIENTANARFGAFQNNINKIVSTEKTDFYIKQQQAAVLLDRAERASESSQADYTTAMHSIWEIDKKVEALEAKTREL